MTFQPHQVEDATLKPVSSVDSSSVSGEGGALLPCPFCCSQLPDDEGDNLIDVLYPTGTGWREDHGFRHYLPRDDERERQGDVWHIGCTQNMGGCGASLMADSREEAIAAWNRRPSPTKGLGSDMPELPEADEASAFSYGAMVVLQSEARAYGDARYAAGVKAGMERAANICNDLMAFDMDDPGSSAAFAIRKESSNG